MQHNIVRKYIDTLHRGHRMPPDQLMQEATELEQAIIGMELSVFASAVEHILGDEIPIIVSWSSKPSEQTATIQVPCIPNLEGEDTPWKALGTQFTESSRTGFFNQHAKAIWAHIREHWEEGLELTDNQVPGLLPDTLPRTLYWWMPSLATPRPSPSAKFHSSPLHGGFILAASIYQYGQGHICKYNPILEPNLHAPHFHQCNAYSLAFAPGFISYLTTKKTPRD